MAFSQRAPTAVVSAVGWTDATQTNIATANSVYATDGDPGESILVDISDAPVNFESLNTVIFRVRGRTDIAPTRSKQFFLELLVNGTPVESFVSNDLTTTNTTYQSAAINRSGDSLSDVNSYQLRVTVQEGGGMPDSAKCWVDVLNLDLDYNVIGSSAAYRSLLGVGR